MRRFSVGKRLAHLKGRPRGPRICAQRSARRCTSSVPHERTSTGANIARIFRSKRIRNADPWPGGGPTLHGLSAGRLRAFRIVQEKLLTLNMLEVLHADHTTATNLFQEARRASKLEQLRKHREDALKAGGQIAGSQ